MATRPAGRAVGASDSGAPGEPRRRARDAAHVGGHAGRSPRHPRTARGRGGLSHRACTGQAQASRLPSGSRSQARVHGRIRERPAPAGGATTTSPHGVRMVDGPRPRRRALDTLRGNADDVPPVARRAWPGGACGGVGRGLTGGARSPGRRRGAARRRVGWGQGGRRGSGQGAGSDRTAPVGRGRARWGSDRAAAVGQGGQALPAGVLHAAGRDARPSRGRACPCIHAAGVSCHAASCGATARVAVRGRRRRRSSRAGRRRAPRRLGQATPMRDGRRVCRDRADARWAPRRDDRGESRAGPGDHVPAGGHHARPRGVVCAGRTAGAMRHACPCKA
jgi:hypothetical protein